ncbi:MAG: hypothetical protein AAGE89_01545 [Pseudomonadota bacterium]
MRGEIIGVWSEMWREVWSKLAKHPNFAPQIFCDLYAEYVDEPTSPKTPLEEGVELDDYGVLPKATLDAYKAELDKYTERLRAHNDAASIPDIARKSLQTAIKRQSIKESEAIAFLEEAHDIIEAYGEPNLVRKYFRLIEVFIEKYSLRYDLRRPFSLHPTLPGVFARLISDLRKTTARDAHLNGLMHEFEDAIRDLKADQSSTKIKTCIHKQMILLEAIAGRCDGVTASTLGDMCNQVNTWPHVTIKEAMKKLYGFSSNYPGIRHAGNPASALREIEMRDLVAVSVMLAGFAPYLDNGLNSETIYRGGG